MSSHSNRNKTRSYGPSANLLNFRLLWSEFNGDRRILHFILKWPVRQSAPIYQYLYEIALIHQRYVWPNMHHDITKWCKNCLDCQQSKIIRHSTKSWKICRVRRAFRACSHEFNRSFAWVVLVQILCDDYWLRFSRWPVARPLKDTEAITVACAFYDNWIANFRAPKTLTTDQGSQFEAQLFTALLQLIGC